PGKYEGQYEEAVAALNVSEADLHKAETDLEAQRHRLQSEIARFETEVRFAHLDLDDLKKRPLPSELAQAQTEVRRAPPPCEKANIARANQLIRTAETRLKVKEITAPRDGVVVYARASENKGNEKIQLGMIPYEGQPILYLPDPSTIVADTEVNEVDIGKVQVGGPTELQLDSLPGVTYRGTVLKIGSLARMKLTPAGTPSGIKVFDVT